VSGKGAINVIYDLIPKQLRGLFDYGAHKSHDRIEISFRVKPDAEAELYRSFGKVAIFTDLYGVSDKEIVRIYNSKWQVENDFKWLKDRSIIPLKPFYV
jgi:transposase